MNSWEKYVLLAVIVFSVCMSVFGVERMLKVTKERKRIFVSVCAEVGGKVVFNGRYWECMR